MSPKSWIRKLFARPVAAPITRRPAANTARLGLEGLDERVVLSVTTGTAPGGIVWSLDYNPASKVGTLTVSGTDQADSIVLQEQLSNAQYNEPGYGDTRAYGISISNKFYSEGQGGLSFDPASQISITVNAGAGADTVENNTRFASVLIGGAGNDFLIGGKGNDVAYGGAGDDTLYGGLGNDTLWGDRDIVNGVVTDRTVYTSDISRRAGNDYLLGGWGSDTLRGGEGDDQLWGDQGRGAWVFGVRQWESLGGDSTGTAGDDVLDAGSGNDTLVGGYGNDTLTGGAGEDWLFGGVGNDSLSGGSDRDYLFGGNDLDTLDGGTGADFIRVGGYNDPYWGVNDYYLPHSVDSDGDQDSGTVRRG